MLSWLGTPIQLSIFYKMTVIWLSSTRYSATSLVTVHCVVGNYTREYLDNTINSRYIAAEYTGKWLKFCWDCGPTKDASRASHGCVFCKYFGDYITLSTLQVSNSWTHRSITGFIMVMGSMKRGVTMERLRSLAKPIPIVILHRNIGNVKSYTLITVVCLNVLCINVSHIRLIYIFFSRLWVFCTVYSGNNAWMINRVRYYCLVNNSALS